MIRPYVQKQAALLLPYLARSRTILDFGCGDLSLARALTGAIPGASITGADVVDSGVRVPGVQFLLYDGVRLPFGYTSFDAAVAYHVFHHTNDPRSALRDVLRVTKHTLLMVEPVYRNRIDIFFMKILDRAGNGWRSAAIPMPFTFQKEHTWNTWAEELGWKVTDILPAGVLPGWLPFGETKFFVFTRLKPLRKK